MVNFFAVLRLTGSPIGNLLKLLKPDCRERDRPVKSL